MSKAWIAFCLWLVSFTPLSPLLARTSLETPTPAAASCGVGAAWPRGCVAGRTQPVVRATLVHYGTTSAAATPTELARVGRLLAERFATSTGGALRLEYVAQVVLPIQPRARPDLARIAAEIGEGGDRSEPRLIRLWHYYHPEVNLHDEIHTELMRQGYRAQLDASDAILVASEVQFEGLGYAVARMGLTEQPVEIAWGGKGGGFTRREPTERVVDELFHELGHILGLDHAAHQCMDFDFSVPESFAKSAQCCRESPSGQDVMSYCRDRTSVAGDRYYGFTACTREYLERSTVAALLRGVPYIPSQVGGGCR